MSSFSDTFRASVEPIGAGPATQLNRLASDALAIRLRGLISMVFKTVTRKLTTVFDQLRARNSSAEKRIQILERTQIAPRQSLTLIEADGVRILLCSTQNGESTFYRLPISRRKDLEKSSNSAIMRRYSGSPRTSRCHCLKYGLLARTSKIGGRA